MRIIKPAAVTALGITAALLLTSCGTSATPAPKIVTQTASPTPTVDQKTVVAETLGKFYNHIFNYPTATQAKVIAALPKSVQSSASAASLTETQAVTVKAAIEKADPYFTYLNTSKMTAKEAVTEYVGTLFAASFFKSAKLTILVSATNIKISGATATVPSSAVKLFKDGQAYDPKKDGGVSISQDTGSGTLHLVNGKWLIDLSKTASTSSATK